MTTPSTSQTNPLDPVFSGIPVVFPQTGMINPTWNKWFVDLRQKLNVINAETATPVIEVHPGTNVTVDNTDPQNPIISSTGGALPSGGTAGQVLTKIDSTPGNADWQTPSDNNSYTPVALLHFDGTNGSTTFTDEYGNIWGAVSSGSVLDTSQYKFGVSSLHVNNGGITSTGLSINWSNPWKIECFFRRTSSSAPSTTQFLFGTSATNGVFISANTTYGFGYYAGGSYKVYTATYPTGSTWHYVVVEFDGTTVYMAVDGTLVGTTTSNWSASGQLYIGRDTSGDTYPDWIDEFRVSTGTTAFPVPTAPYPPP